MRLFKFSFQSMDRRLFENKIMSLLWCKLNGKKTRDHRAQVHIHLPKQINNTYCQDKQHYWHQESLKEKWCLGVCSSFCMLCLNIAVLWRESAQEECHNDVFLSHWFGLALCLSVPCCHWKYTSWSWNCNWNTFKCSIVCWMVISLCLLAAHSLSIRGAKVRVIVNFHKTSNRLHAAASLMESNMRESAIVILLYSVCVGCLKRHVSGERPTRAPSLSMSACANLPGFAGNLCSN